MSNDRDEPYLDALARAIRDGARLHAFRSGGGLRVVRLERGEQLVAYGEHPSIDDALAHAAEDYLAGGRPYEKVYGGSKPHYLTGSSTPSSPLDAWILAGNTFDAFRREPDVAVELRGWNTDIRRVVKRAIGAYLNATIAAALCAEELPGE